MQRTVVQVGSGYASLPPATLGRMQLPFVHQRCATQRTGQRIPDLARRNRIVHWHQQYVIVGDDLAKRGSSTQPIEPRATRQGGTAHNRARWVARWTRLDPCKKKELG
jgi:hypothetical protein